MCVDPSIWESLSRKDFVYIHKQVGVLESLQLMIVPSFSFLYFYFWLHFYVKRIRGLKCEYRNLIN